jgi:hypothetical protein
MSAATKHRQPWPMKWIVLAILLFIVPYTFLTLHYRKPGPAYRPYEDMKNRANTARLLSAGYQRVTLPARRPADSDVLVSSAPMNAARGGLPEELRTTLVAPPTLPADIVRVSAGPTASARMPYPIQFTCTTPDDKQQLAGAELYLKDDQIIITPDFELLTGGLLTRTRETLILLTVPPATLKPGRYQVTLAGRNSSRSWTLQVH